ncbi:kinase-like protein [Marasmius fiardii PR-910]|nr:kinase-like protein [Marasmius fiardii PR-910]
MNLAKLYNSKNASNLHAIRRVVENVLEDEKQVRSLLETKAEEAQIWLDTLQVLADFPEVTSKLRSSTLKMMLRLSKRSGLCPQCFMVKNVKRLGEFPVGGGGFGDVWKGKIGGQLVCLKVVKVYLVSDVRQLLKEYASEAIVWQQLERPNLLPFMGMYYLDKAREQLRLVSPWMERGNLVRFLKDTPREQIDHYSLAYDIASGLVYLHSRKIVHGDLKGVNILLTPDERACIGDFGLSRVADSHAVRLTSSTTMHSKGTTRWLSPELLKSDPPCSSSTSSDMYAFACVCYEASLYSPLSSAFNIFAGNVPFYELTDGAVIVAVLLDKKHPSHPGDSLLNDEMWNIMVSCWKPETQLRPSASEVFSRLSGMKSFKTGRVIQPTSQWDTLNADQLWKNVKRPPLDLDALVRLQKKLDPSVVVRPTAVAKLTQVDSRESASSANSLFGLFPPIEVHIAVTVSKFTSSHDPWSQAVVSRDHFDSLDDNYPLGLPTRLASPFFGSVQGTVENKKIQSTSSHANSDFRVVVASDGGNTFANSTALPRAGEDVKVKVHFVGRVFFLDVSPSIGFTPLASMICREISSSYGVFRNVNSILIDWEEEDGRLVALIADRDVRRALKEGLWEGKVVTSHIS